MQPWGKILVPHQRIHTTIPLSCFADNETPSRWEKLTCCPEAHRPQTSWNQKVDDADSYLPHHQPIRRMSMNWLRPSLNHYYKTSDYPLQVGTHSFLRQEPTVSPFACQSNKAILFTSPKTLSLRFDLALVYREAELLASTFRSIWPHCVSGTGTWTREQLLIHHCPPISSNQSTEFYSNWSIN